ncbi:hypothetical protein GOP47_0003283 [Adiantum capillus-veneris]|uniref:Uncharacterized protein n=1 Tax=Adiantum capillus-veneris TaxID=13818 RepID=A0A9D4VCI8_ADICA|nr:hypothetical protein GOP47_0003283 [Adiantum capillus-veneris]
MINRGPGQSGCRRCSRSRSWGDGSQQRARSQGTRAAHNTANQGGQAESAEALRQQPVVTVAKKARAPEAKS